MSDRSGIRDTAAVRSAPHVAFLPGAAGHRDFWTPVAERLPPAWRKTLLAWPGAGDEPHSPDVRSFDDLIGVASTALEDQTDVVAQSMGGVVAIGLALAHPEKVR